MIGIYKITNKNNGKSYIGQSIHCGKRLDEHCKGEQLIDNVIQIEGVSNFTFNVLKEVDKSELSYWEDYYIIKYNTMFPNGYNQRWNCNAITRETIRNKINSEQIEEQQECKIKQEYSLINFFDELNGKILYTYFALLFHAIHLESEYYWDKKHWVGTKIAKICNLNYRTWSKYKEIFEKYNIIVYNNDKIMIKNITTLTDFITFQDFLKLNYKELYVLWKIRYENNNKNNAFYTYELFWKQGGSAASRNISGVKEVLSSLIDKEYIDVTYPDAHGRGLFLTITLKK